MKKILLFFGIAALFASCASDDATDNKTNETTLSAIIDDSDEMTRVDLDGTSNKFAANDRLRVWSDQDSEGEYMYVSTAGSGSQKLTGDAPERTNFYYAAGINTGYDISSDRTTNGSTVDMWFPRDDKAIFVSADKNALSNTEFPLVGKTSMNGNNIVLKNVACLLRMQVTNSSGKDIKSISIEDADGVTYIKGQYRIRIYNLYNTARAAESQTSDFGDRVLKQNVTIAKGTTSYVYFVVSDIKNLKPKITFYEGTDGTNSIKSITTKNDVTTLHGKIVNMGTYTVPAAPAGHSQNVQGKYYYGKSLTESVVTSTNVPCYLGTLTNGYLTSGFHLYYQDEEHGNANEIAWIATGNAMRIWINNYIVDEIVTWKDNAGNDRTGGVWLHKTGTGISGNSGTLRTTIKTEAQYTALASELATDYFFVPFAGSLNYSGKSINNIEANVVINSSTYGTLPSNQFYNEILTITKGTDEANPATANIQKYANQTVNPIYGLVIKSDGTFITGIN